MINIENMCLTIGKKSILTDINCIFEEGHIYGLIGLNGSGKTMLMKCICGFIKPTEGSIKINEITIGKDREFPEQVGFLIETPGFIPSYSGYKNLKSLAALRGDISKEEIIECMEVAGINNVGKKKVGKYSLGMKQRLGIAQAMLGKPPIYILDEPMNALDKYGIVTVRKFLLEEKDRGKIIILASHNHEDIEALCDVVYEMDEGRLTSK